jgi:hypothetical protein
MPPVMGRRIRIGVALVTGVLVLAFAASAQAAFVVQNNHDEGPGSLREGIAVVENGGTVQVPTSVGPIELNSELKVLRSIKIEAIGTGRAVIDAHHRCRIFYVQASAVEMAGLELIEGRVATTGATAGETALGGAILLASGHLNLANDFIQRSEADASVGAQSELAAGGAILGATLTDLELHNTIVTDNRALGGTGGVAGQAKALGGGITSGGELTIQGGEVKGNTAQAADAKGGGIAFQSTQSALLEGVSVSGNEATLYVGKTGNSGGGGLDLEGPATLSGVTVARNRALADNAASDLGVAEAGGVRTRAAVTIVNSTFDNNLASAVVNENGLAIGAALAAAEAPVSVVNSTLADNTLRTGGTNSASFGASIWAAEKVTVENTILAPGETSTGANCYNAAAGSIVSAGGNIDSGQSCGFAQPGDRSNTDPKLGPLAANGGPVETMALLAGSPAIDGGTASGCPATDARGVLRPDGAGCDVGAFEVATPSARTAAASAVGTTGATLAGSATNPDLAGGSVSFQYGTTVGYGAQTAAQAIGPTTRAAGFTAAIGGLTPATTYHFRIVVTNALGTAVGPDLTFTTATPPRTVTTGGPQPQLRVKHVKGLRFRVTCSGGRACQGNLTARTGTGKKAVVVAKAKVRLTAGQTKTVTLTPTGKGRLLLARPGKLPVVVKATIRNVVVPKPLHLKLS